MTAPAGRFVVIAGGGTAGHVHPGLAVARALVERGHDAASILYVGSQRGIEHELVPPAGFELVSLPGRGVPRRSPVAAARASLTISRGVAEGVMLLRRERPRVVLSLGGFASVPCAVGARALRIPVVVHEQNAVPGAANRMIGRFAKACAVSFPNTDLPHAVMTGNPVRPEMLAVDRSARDEARAALGVSKDRTLVVVTGGSLGALNLNRAALAAAKTWRDRSDLAVHHVIGARDWDLLEAERAEASAAGAGLQYRAVRYEHEMPDVFNAADLVVSRAGASTTAELAVVGVASILVPLPGAPGDHQTRNADALVQAGAAERVTDADFDGDLLVTTVDRLLADPARLPAMSAAATQVARPDAADHVAQLLEEHAR